MLFTDTINACAEVAGILWQKGWAERNGGNLVVNITDEIDDTMRRLPPLAPAVRLAVPLPALTGRYFYCKGTGCRMRDLARKPMDNGSIIRIAPDGASYEVIACKPIMPTSELPSHLAVHHKLVETGSDKKATLHTHPTELVALSHLPQYASTDELSRCLWDMIPETRLFCPKGIGVLPYAEPGSEELAEGTLRLIVSHDAVLWAKHGVFSIGTDIIDAFDTIDILNKSAQIRCSILVAGNQ
ncbi:MAG: rhamnulose-1-phosphate aldolase [Bacteroidales bacterium]|nr:rhamnulose-1-phosphate aldolase [Bacteroidales bacterium]